MIIKKYAKIFSISLFFILLSSQNIFPQFLNYFPKLDPSLEWKSIKTDHFWIHYHHGLEDVAQRLVPISERIHKKLTKDIQWTPYLRTDIVLIDDLDMANGFATPFPSNRIQIYISRPELDGILNNYDDWLKLVFTHEYTHILNLDTIHGIPAATRVTCGRICFPNCLLPIWTLEGNAVYHESRDSIFGRNNSTFTDMVFRIEIANKNLKSITEASHFPRKWPMGNVPYLYGGLFVEYLEKRFGKDSFASFFKENADNVFPFLVNTNANDVYKNSFLTLWDDWNHYVTQKYSNQIKLIKSNGVTPLLKISSSGIRTSLPRFSSDGESLYFIKNNYETSPSLVKYYLGKRKRLKRARDICVVNYPNSIAVSPSGELFISDLEFYRSYSIYNEAFRFDSKYTKLTSNLRAKYIDIFNHYGQAVFITNRNNKYSLIISDLSFQNHTKLIEMTDIQLAYSKVSPDDKKIVMSIKDTKGFTDVLIFDIETKESFRISKDRYNDISPTWHPNGKKIIFSSDRTGVYNLYEYDIIKKTIIQVTNLLGGAFSPDISPDGKKIAFSSYGKNGFDIAIINYPENKTENIKLESEPFSFQTTKSPDITRFPSQNYSTWNSLINLLWIPLYGSSEIYEGKNDNVIEILTGGIDALYRHFYFLDVLYAFQQKRTQLNFQYILSSFYPDFFLEYKDTTLIAGEDEFPWEEDDISKKRTMERGGSGGIYVPFNFFNWQHMILLSYSYDRTFTDLYLPEEGVQNHKDTLANYTFAYAFTNAKMYNYSISKEDGRDFFLIADNYSSQAGSDISFYKVRSEYAEYLPGIGDHNVIMFRLRGGFSNNNSDYLSPYNLGRFEKDERGAVAVDEDQFGLRGYPAGLIYGNRLASATIEYRLPLFQKDIGSGTLPLMFRDIWITFFSDYGNVWDNTTHISDFKSSAGAEIHLNLTLSYNFDIHGYIGYSHGFNEYGENQVYFAVSTLYEGAFKKRKLFDFL